jgi:hypothetical protein
MFGYNREYVREEWRILPKEQLMICNLTLYYYGDEINKDEMRGVCVMYEEEETYSYIIVHFFVGKPEGEKHL